MSQGKIPFLLWCVHPMFFGCKEVTKILNNMFTNVVTMNEGRFKILFIIVIGTGVGFLG